MTKYIKIQKLSDLRRIRSTQNILNVASELISKNEDRLGKKLVSNQNQGELVNLNCFKNGKDEAICVSKIIEEEVSKI